MEINQEIYDYVQEISKKIKNRDDREDVAQETLTILCEKNIIGEPLTPRLREYIKGIVWNYSTTLFNDFHNAVSNRTYNADALPDYVITGTYTEDREDFKQLLSVIRSYVFNNYYKKGKKLTKWRVFYLILKGYSYKDIMVRLNIAYKTVVEYNFQTTTEIKKNLGVEISDKIQLKPNSLFSTTSTGHEVTNWTVSNSFSSEDFDIRYE